MLKRLADFCPRDLSICVESYCSSYSSNSDKAVDALHSEFDDEGNFS